MILIIIRPVQYRKIDLQSKRYALSSKTHTHMMEVAASVVWQNVCGKLQNACEDLRNAVVSSPL